MKLSSLSLVKYALAAVLTLLFGTAYSQYPATGNKQRLGWQTTGDGLVYRGAIADTATINPGGLNNAWMLLDTVNGNLYAYREHWWQLVSGGGGGITMPLDSVAFDTSYVSGFPTGTMAYDADNETVSVGIDGGVIYQLGQELFYPVVVNKSDSLIKNGQLVMVDTATLIEGDRVRVIQARNGANYPSNYIMGVATTDIPDDSTGLVTFFGYVREVKHADIAQSGDTLIPGNILYPSPTQPGRYTNVPPSTPAHKSTIALVVRKPNPNNMTLLVRPWLAPKLEDASDVDTAGIGQNSVLRYDTASGYWKASATAGIVGSGINNYLPKFTGASSIGNSLFFDNGTQTMIGGTTPAYNLSRFSIYYNPVTTGPPILVDTRAYNSAILPGGSWNVGGQYDSLGTYASFAAFAGKKENSNNLDTKGEAQIFVNNGGDIFPDEAVRIKSDGKVGIGTTTPSRTLHVAGEARITDLTTDTPTQIVGADADGDLGAITLGTGLSISSGTLNGPSVSGTTNYLPKFTGASSIGNSPILNVADNQLVVGHNAVGTGAKNVLEIRGTGNTDLDGTKVDLYVNSSGQDYHSPIMSLRRSRGATAGAFTKAEYNDWLGQLLFNGADGDEYTGGAGIRAVVDSVTGNNDMPASLYFLTTPNGSSSLTTHMTINNAGRVGIGTTTPSRSLHISATDAVRIPVGTAVQRLTSASGDIRFNSDSTVLEFYDGTGWRKPIVTNRGNGKGVANSFLKFDAAGFADTSAVLIQNGDKIGIGTASPDSTLTVNGSARVTRLAVNTSGTQRLNINNYYRADQSTNGQNIWIGNGGQLLDTTGYYNGANTASNNIGIGNNSLLNLRAGRDNLALGIDAGRGIIYGTYNVVLGALSLATRSDGSSANVAIGNFAMQFNGTKDNTSNVAIGSNALRYNRGGNYNVALGSAALTQNVPIPSNDSAGEDGGSNNFGLGFSSCFWNGKGIANVGIGSNANYFNRNGSYNIAIGSSALAGGSSNADTIAKNNNVVIGTEAFQYLKGNGAGNADENVAIGHQAARTFSGGSNTTAAKQGIYIGALTKPSANTNTNEIVIGYNATGNGSNTTTIGNSSTTATYIPAGKMYVGGTTSPGATLHVNGSLSRNAPVTVTDATHTVAETTSWLICNRAGTVTLTLPTASSWTGREIMVKTIQAQTVISNATNISPLDGGALTTAILPATDGAWATLVSDGTNWIIMQRGS